MVDLGDAEQILMALERKVITNVEYVDGGGERLDNHTSSATCPASYAG